MKNLLVVLAVIFSGVSSALAEETRVLLEHQTMVGFAPPAHRGTYRTQLLNDGKVQHIDNNGGVTAVATLSKASLEKVASSVKYYSDHDIDSIELTPTNDGPPCLDAPTHAAILTKTDGTRLMLWQRAGCRDYAAYGDSRAMTLARIINLLDDTRGAVDALRYVEMEE